MALDPKQHADWEIAQDAESRMKDIYQIGRELGLEDKELLPYGHVMGKVDYPCSPAWPTVPTVSMSM